MHLSKEQLPTLTDFLDTLHYRWQEVYPNPLLQQVSASLDADASYVPPLELSSQISIPMCVELDDGLEEDWRYDTPYTMYLSNISTRGLEVKYVKNELRVRVLSLSCPEEWELAWLVLESAPHCDDAVVKTDWAPNIVPLRSIRDVFSQEKIAEALHKQFIAVVDCVEKQQKSVALSGPLADSHVGPWLWQRLLAAFPDPDARFDELLDTMFSIMRILNYADQTPKFAGICVPHIEEVQSIRGKVSTACIEAGRRYLVPVVDALAFWQEGCEPVTILAEDFKDCLSKHFQELTELLWLDEYQFIINPLTDDRYAEVMAKLDQFLSKTKAPQKNWLRRLFG